MSDYRYEIVNHNGIDCLHVLIDAEPMAETHIPLSDIAKSVARYAVSQKCYVCGEPADYACPDCGRWICMEDGRDFPPDFNGHQCAECVGKQNRAQVTQWREMHARGETLNPLQLHWIGIHDQCDPQHCTQVPVAHQEGDSGTVSLKEIVQSHPSERGLYDAWREAVGLPDSWRLPPTMRGEHG